MGARNRFVIRKRGRVYCSHPMESSSSWKRNLQIILLVMLAAAGIRLYLIFRERNAPVVAPRSANSGNRLTSDDYVVPAKLRAFDLRSLRQGVQGKTIWVHAGNQLAYYPYDSQAHRVIFRSNQLLPPLAELHVQDVVLAARKGNPEQLMLVFAQAGENGSFAVSVGNTQNGESGIYFDDAFFIEDPRQLYKHWPPDVWDAVDHHQAKPGMNELQTSFALGAGQARGGGGSYGNRTLEFENAGKPVRVTFENNRVVEIQPVTAP